jgi:cell division GTPase FtsZ
VVLRGTAQKAHIIMILTNIQRSITDCRSTSSMVGLGESDSQDRARDAVLEALNSPLLDALMRS